MATVIGDKVKLDNGQIITPAQGGWYDAKQFWNGTLSVPGSINTQSNQPGAGQPVSNEVVSQTNPANVGYIQQQLAKPAATPAPAAPGTTPGVPIGQPGTAGAGTGVGFTPAPTINLPDLYKTMYASSGISTLESDLTKKMDDYSAARAKIADNPFLSEATLTGRLKKLSDAFDLSAATTKNDIATKKADIETQLNLQTKQFDINSQAAQQALSQFNTLLGMGALDNASGEDIANITRSTGLSSAAIYSAVNAQKAKNVKTSVHMSTADDGTVTAVVINDSTGAIVAKTNLGQIGNAQTGNTKASASDQKTSVELDVQKYISTPALQAQVSPEDLYIKLLTAYPDAVEYIKSNWTALQIRLANGEESPYGWTIDPTTGKPLIK